MIKVAVLTASDRASRGEREDVSGQVIGQFIEKVNAQVVYYKVLPDEREDLEKELRYLADQKKVNIVFTTGGTGLAPRDYTPEATASVIEKEVPGLAEAMRAASFPKTPHAMLSRAVCGIRGQTLIINLPGSPKAVRECLEVILPALPHAVELLLGDVADCASSMDT